MSAGPGRAVHKSTGEKSHNMSAIISKASTAVNTAVSKSTQYANCALYWGKVAAEVGKTVYKKEGLAPPSQAQFRQVYDSLLKLAKSPAEQRRVLGSVQKLLLNKENATKGAVFAVHVLGFFSVGEIIGRRKLVGYPSVGH